MPRTRTLVLTPALVLAAAASSFFLFLHAPIVRAQCGSDASAPACPTPVNAFLSLDVTQGDDNTVINVTGGQFLPNEQISLYWDASNKVAGSATADAGGSFNTRVKPFAGDPAGTHKLCASVAPNPCATFTLQAATPSPSPSPTPTESPSPSAVATVTTTPSTSPVAATLNGFDVISRPPFVFLPIAGAAAIGLALVFWAFTVMRRPRPLAIPSAAVVHRATRPDYTAAFGVAPAPAPPAPEESAWPQQARPEPAPPQPAAEESQATAVEWGPPVEWGKTGSSDWGFPEPPDQSQALGDDNLPEPPQPGD